MNEKDSSLSGQLGSGRLLLPDLIFMPPGLMEWGEAENKLANDHIRFAAISVETSPLEVQIQILQKALDDVKAGDFSIGSTFFEVGMSRSANFAHMAWWSLRRRHRQLYPTVEKVAELIDSLGEYDIAHLQKNLLELWGMPVPGPVELKNLQAGEKQTNGSPAEKEDTEETLSRSPDSSGSNGI